MDYTVAQIREYIAAAVAEFPDLTPFGFFGGGSDWDPKEVATAIEFLKLCGRSKRATRSSYALKHDAERWGRATGGAPYITNGALIVAAHTLGFVIRRYAGQNPRIGISLRGLRRCMQP